MAAPLRLTGFCAKMVENVPKPYKSGDKDSFYKLHKEPADRILSFHPWDYAKILHLEQPIKEEMMVAAFSVLSSILSPEGNIGLQYELAQEAHNCKEKYLFRHCVLLMQPDVWQAAKSYGIDMSEFSGTGNDDPPTFSGSPSHSRAVGESIWSKASNFTMEPTAEKAKADAVGESVWSKASNFMMEPTAEKAKADAVGESLEQSVK